MNNNPENNNENNDIDDILDILKKRKEQDSKKSVNDDPTRVTSRIIVPDHEAFKEKKGEEQSSMFDDCTSMSFDVVSAEKSTKADENSKTAEIVIGSTAKNADKSEASPQAKSDISSDTVSTTETAEKKPKTADVRSLDTGIEPPKNTPSTTFSVMPEESKKTKDTPEKAKPASIKKTAPAVPPVAPPAAAPVKKAAPRGNYDSAPKVSLEDFDSIPTKPKKKEKNNSNNKVFIPGYVKVIVYLLIVLAVSIFISASVISITNDVFALTKDSKEITVEIKEDATVKEVAKELKDKGVIKYSGIYKLYLKFRTEGNMDGKFIAGKHTLNSDMNYEQIIKLLSVSDKPDEIVRVTIPEGYTIREILDLLQEKKVIDSESRLKLEAKLNDTTGLDYDFLPEMPKTVTDEKGNKSLDTEKIYLLEGYIFPDTYDFYVGENVDSILAKFLNNFDEKFDETFYEKCEDLGMTVDEVITLASIIQAEGNNDLDFYYISHVFHNRLFGGKTKSPSDFPTTNGEYPALESDATTLYYYQGEIKTLGKGDNQTLDNPYNTYTNAGLPPGAVCNPGHEAIYAALHPRYKRYDENGDEYEVEYYFFYSDENGVTTFTKTNEEHEATYS